MPAGLIALALGGFGIGLTEFVIAGLLPEVAAGFHVDAAAAGWLITGYALAVAVGAIGLTAAVTRLPAAPAAPAAPASGLRGELRTFRSGQLWLSLAATVLGFGGMFGAFTYIAYTLTGLSGFPAAVVPWLLVLFGLGLFAGNAVGGRFADRSIDGTLLVVLAVLAVILGAFALLAAQPAAAVVALVLMGAFGFATVPGLQLRVLRSADDAPTLASGANIAAFNVGNALGAWLGGLTIAAGLGYASPLWVGAAMTVAALAVIAVAWAARTGHFRSGRQRSTVAPVSNGRPTIRG